MWGLVSGMLNYTLIWGSIQDLLHILLNAASEGLVEQEFMGARLSKPWFQVTSNTLFGDALKWNLGSQSRLALNLGSENFVEKLNILSLSGFSWPKALVQAWEVLWNTWLHLLAAEPNFHRFGYWVWFRVEAVDFQNCSFFPSLWRSKF